MAPEGVQIRSAADWDFRFATEDRANDKIRTWPTRSFAGHLNARRASSALCGPCQCFGALPLVGGAPEPRSPHHRIHWDVRLRHSSRTDAKERPSVPKQSESKEPGNLVHFFRGCCQEPPKPCAVRVCRVCQQRTSLQPKATASGEVGR